MEKKINAIKTHVVIIPDGNRRWAKRKGLQPWDGHEAGAKIVEELIQVAFEKGITCFSVWGSSMDNLLKRPMREKVALLKIYETYFQKLLAGDDLDKKEVRVSIIGHWEEQFPQSLKKLIQKIIDKTKHYKKNMLNFMLAYSGTDDMLQAFEKINNKYEQGKTITAQIVKENLMTALLPPVDFMIRTGGEPHNSNGFLMWDSANAQLKFSSELFPDFNGKKFTKALDEYAQRKRRFGK